MTVTTSGPLPTTHFVGHQTHRRRQPPSSSGIQCGINRMEDRGEGLSFLTRLFSLLRQLTPFHPPLAWISSTSLPVIVARLTGASERFPFGSYPRLSPERSAIRRNLPRSRRKGSSLNDLRWSRDWTPQMRTPDRPLHVRRCRGWMVLPRPSSRPHRLLRSTAAPFCRQNTRGEKNSQDGAR